LGASTLLSFAPAVPEFLARTALAADRRPSGDTILVAVQLSGGNDGLNTVVPYEDDVYGRSRRTLRLTPKEVLKIDAQLGFHPNMQSTLRLYKEGTLSVVQGVGYPDSNRDHARAMLNWHTGRPAEPTSPTGWLGRVIDGLYDPDGANVPGVFVGDIAQPFALTAATAVVPSIRSLDRCVLRTAPGRNDLHRQTLAQASALPRSDKDPLLDFVRRGTLAAYASSRRIEAVVGAQASAGAAEYPSFQLAQTFRSVAQLIRADLGIRVFLAELGGGGFGGFDNHANQRGNHEALLRELSESLAAFVGDLRRDKVLDRVLLMTFSEFGRTVGENGRRGTDHGAAAPVLLAGSRLRGGLIGPHPSLTDLDNGALKFHTDFRSVYATVLDRWLGVDSQAVLGAKFKHVEMLNV
jgi:uncharacterized protein (DUF1501 family)